MSQHVRVKLCTSRLQLDKERDLWLSCSQEEGHTGEHRARAYGRETFWGIDLAAQQPRESLSAATPTLTFDGIGYHCAQCGSNQAALCEHWQAFLRKIRNTVLNEIAERALNHNSATDGPISGWIEDDAEQKRRCDILLWLLDGGGGHEGGADGLRAMSITAEGLIDFLSAYHEHLEGNRRLASAEKGERVGAAKSDELKHHPDYRQFLSGIESHIKDYPNLGECEWNCITAGPLLELVAKVKAECAAAAPAGEQIEGLRKEERQQWAEKVAIGVRMRKLIEMLDGEVETIKSKGYRDNLPDLVEWTAKIQAALLAAGGKG